MAHLTEDELVAWRDNPDAEDDQLAGHLAECATCAAAYASLLRSPRITELTLTDDEVAPVDAELALVVDDSPLYFKPKPSDSIAFVYAAIKDPRTAAKPFGPYAWRAWASLAAVVAVVWTLISLMPAPQSATALTQSRGAIEVLEPANAGDLQTRIQWRSTVTEATQFQVLFKDDGGAVVFGVVTSARQASLPAEIVERLQPERTYTWTITALNPGAVALASRSRTFSVPGAAAR